MAHYRRDLFRLLEAALVGLFFVQAARFLFGTLYAHVSSASLVVVTTDPATLFGQPGVVNVADVQTEVLFTGALLLLPLLYFIFGRLWFGPALVAIVAAAGRVFLTANGGTTLGVFGAAVTVGAAMLYLACIAVRRPSWLPVMLIFGFATDQIIRLYGWTADTTWQSTFLVEQTVLSLALFLIAVFSAVFERITPSDEARGEITGWGAFALGGLLFVEFTLFALPHTLGHRVGVSYGEVAPFLIVATLLPLVPAVRDFMRQFFGMFDAGYRGWIWFLMLALLVVVGFRVGGVIGAGALIAAQFLIGLSLWWVAQPSTRRFNFTGFGALFGTASFLLLAGAEFFTFEYAFVRGIEEPFGALLRAFRGLGIAVVLIGLLFGALPAILSRKRPPWKGGPFAVTAAAVVLIVTAAALAFTFGQTTPVRSATQPDRLRVVTLNLHGGYSLYYDMNLPEIARQIDVIGADVLLLQEVNTGRLISFSIDQAGWLARALAMRVVYFPTNEGLEGLAVLSRVPVEIADGRLLPGRSKQTGVQFVRLRTPDSQTLDVYNIQLSLLFRAPTLSIEDQAQDQDQQMLGIFDYIKANGSDSRRMLIGGTFNHTPDTKIYQILGQSRYIDPLAGYPPDRGVTLRRVNNPPARVDYVWLYCPQQGAPNCVAPLGADIVPIPQSSHNLALVEIRLGQ
jgi:endonuclease/exonuclease/phosphatase family metal-dependent hydrolase